MKNATTRIAIMLAAAGMAFAPIAAQANTRAGDSQAVYSTSAAQPGVSTKADGEDIVSWVSGIGLIISFFAAAAITVAVVAAADDNQTAGSN